jgi:hypothetical protein
VLGFVLSEVVEAGDPVLFGPGLAITFAILEALRSGE